MATKVASLYAEISGNNQKLDSALKDSKAKIGTFKDSVSGLGGKFQQLTGLSLGAAGAIGMAGMALNKAIDLTKQSVNETVAYNKTVREMTQVTGLGAEEISRIIQVGDDWGISIDSIRTSLAFMNKQGVTPSIDTLARMADEYVAATDKSKWANEAVKVLGRGYETLIPILAKGGDALRAQTDAVSDSLIATDDSIASAREYEVAMDNISDTAQGLKYRLGNELLPTIIKVTDALNDMAIENLDVMDAAELLRNAHEAGIITDKELATALKDLRTGTLTTAQVTNKYTDAIEKLNYIEEYNTQIEREEAIRRGKLIPPTEEVDVATRKLTLSVAELNEAKWDEFNALQKSNEALRDAQSAIEHTNGAYADYIDAMGGSIDNEIRDFKESQSDINDEIQENADRIAELNGLSYLTPDQQQELDDLKQSQKDLQTEYANNAIEHEKALRKILLDMAIEKLAAADLTAEERRRGEDMIQALMIKWDLIDQSTLDNIQRAKDYADLINSGQYADAKLVLEGTATKWDITQRNAQLAAGNAGAYASVVNGLDGKVVNVEIITKYTNIGNPNPVVSPGAPPDNSGNWKWDGKQWVPAGHSGLDFIVPSGYPNDSFPILAESGERVTITPSGGGKRMDRGDSSFTFGDVNINSQPNQNGYQLYQQFKQALQNDMRAAKRSGVPYSDY